jgi:hypothetical protein
MTRHTLVATDHPTQPAGDRHPTRPAGNQGGSRHVEGRRVDDALLGHGSGDEVSLLDSFVTRLGDQIDDRVALAVDEQLAERLAEPGILRSALRRDRRAGLAVVCASVAMGACVTIFAPGGMLAVLIGWTAITLINLAYLLRRR